MMHTSRGGRRIALAALAWLAFGAAAAAQAPPPPPAAPAAAQAEPVWQRTASVNGSFASAPFIQGVIDPAVPTVTSAVLGLPGRQINIQTNVSVQRVSKTDAVSVTGSVTYVNAQPTGTLSELFSIEVDYRRFMSARTYWLSRTTEKRDAVRNIGNAFSETVAIGFSVSQSPRLKLDLVPGLVVHRESNNTRFDDEWLVSAGAMAALVSQLSPTASFQARITARQSFQHRSIYSMESYTGLQAQVTRRVGLMVGLTYNIDNLLAQSFTDVPAGQFFPGSPALRLFATEKTLVNLTSGLQVTF